MAGEGEVIPNGSMHWRVNHRPVNPRGAASVTPAGTGCRGVDTSDPATHPFLDVTLRFATQALAEQALQTAIQGGGAAPNTGTPPMWQVTIRVPMVIRNEQQANVNPPNPWAQLFYSWGNQATV